MVNYKSQLALEEELDTVQIVSNLIAKNCEQQPDSDFLYRSVLLGLFEELKKLVPTVADVENPELLKAIDGQELTIKAVTLDQFNQLYPELISNFSQKVIFLPVLMSDENLESAKTDLNNFAEELAKVNQQIEQ